MATLNEYIKFLVEAAKEVNGSDIDWGDIPADEDQTYVMLAMSLMENKGLEDIHIARATILSLLVQNFVLQYKLYKK